MKGRSHTIIALMIAAGLQLSSMIPDMAWSTGSADLATGKLVFFPQNKSHDSFWQKMMKFFGVSSNPSALRGGVTEGGPVNGSVWLVTVSDLATTKLTADSSYSSPIFLAQGEHVLALKGKHLVEISTADGKTAQVCSVADIYKLVGFDRENLTSVLVLTEKGDGEFSVGLLSLPTCAISPVSYDPLSEDDQRLLQHLEDWDRVYGDTKVFVLNQTKRSSTGVVEWTDVFVKTAGGDAINATHCDGVNCGQPSLSVDGKLIVFVKDEVR